MDLPKIKNENLPKELREILGDQDAHFDAIVDPSDIFIPSLDIDSFKEGSHRTRQMLIESRKKLQEYKEKARHESKRNNSSSKKNHQGTQDQQEIVD
tara:strand:- start:259 stop:549 length:291 start_codon:yes stop_codon:yes gene_type:complete